MELAKRVVVVTGGGNGIGAAMCRRFATEGARAVVVADLDGEAAAAVADEIGGEAVRIDVSDPDAVAALVDATQTRYGPIDLFCSNAGIGGIGGVETSVDDWHKT